MTMLVRSDSSPELAVLQSGSSAELAVLQSGSSAELHFGKAKAMSLQLWLVAK